MRFFWHCSSFGVPHNPGTHPWTANPNPSSLKRALTALVRWWCPASVKCVNVTHEKCHTTQPGFCPEHLQSVRSQLPPSLQPPRGENTVWVLKRQLSSYEYCLLLQRHGFRSYHHPLGNSQPFLTLVPGDPETTYGLPGPCAHMMHRHLQAKHPHI